VRRNVGALDPHQGHGPNQHRQRHNWEKHRNGMCLSFCRA
jgi:hypothetical protein